MGAILTKPRTTYFAPTRGRHYMTRMGAAKAEAAAMMKKKYPSESPEYGNYGECHYPGFHWREDGRLVVTWLRLARRLFKASRTQP